MQSLITLNKILFYKERHAVLAIAEIVHFNLTIILFYRPTADPKFYWINTSANGLIRQLIFQEHMLKINDIQALIDGKPV